MPLKRLPALACLLLAGCQAAPVAEQAAAAPADQQWQASTLSQATIAQAEAAVRDYRLCLGRETQARLAARGDPRVITNAILQACEGRLPAIKTAFDAENVPAVISEHKIKQTRSQGVQSVLREVSSVQALYAGDEEEAQAQAKPGKTKQTPAKPSKRDPE